MFLSKANITLVALEHHPLKKHFHKFSVTTGTGILVYFCMIYLRLGVGVLLCDEKTSKFVREHVRNHASQTTARSWKKFDHMHFENNLSKDAIFETNMLKQEIVDSETFKRRTYN